MTASDYGLLLRLIDGPKGAASYSPVEQSRFEQLWAMRLVAFVAEIELAENGTHECTVTHYKLTETGKLALCEPPTVTQRRAMH